MSQYPEPPNPNQAHYTPIYPAPPAQMVENDVKESLPYPPRSQQHTYPNIEPSLADPSLQSNHANNTSQIEQRTAAALAQHSQQQAQQAQQVQLQQQQQAQQAQQHQQHQDQIPPPQLSVNENTPQKSNRLRKACDSCSVRKVKCDESGPPCRACSQLDIPCTFDRPSRRRGPPNRHAEAIKRRRLEEGGLGLDSPSSPTGQAVQALAALSAYPGLGAEQICSHDTVTLLINDFFTYIHPLCPFPHEPTFRRQWADREDQKNPRFLALLASMIGALVASFPRKPRLHLKAQRKDKLFPTHMSLVARCMEVCADARGPRYLLNPEDLNVHDACTSYFLGLTGAYTFNWRQCRLHFGECLNMMRALGLHHAGKEQEYMDLGGLPGMLGSVNGPNEAHKGPPMDKITEQIARRLFWTSFVGMKTLQQSGASFGEVTIPPSTPSEPYPPFPEEVDDDYITAQYIGEQPADVLPLIAGFNANCKVYSSYSQLTSMEMAYGIGEIFDFDRQKRLLEACLQTCKSVLDNVAPELKVWPSGGQFGQSNESYYPPLPEYAGVRNLNPTSPLDPDQDPAQRRKTQYEIQKANIYASHLSTRSYIVEKFFNMRDAHERMQSQKDATQSPNVVTAGLDSMLSQSNAPNNYDPDEEAMSIEREQIIKDLLVVLGSISQVNMEPNGDSFTSKTRQVAATLLDVPKSRKGSLALQADSYLMSFLEILSRLERASPSSSDGMQSEDEELRAWADLREHQAKFQQVSSVFGFS